MSDSLRPHGLQHARPPCPSPTPGVHSNPCALSQWYHPTISSSVLPFSCPQSFPASGSFPMSQFFTPGHQRIGASASASVFPMNIQDCNKIEVFFLLCFKTCWFISCPDFLILCFASLSGSASCSSFLTGNADWNTSLNSPILCVSKHFLWWVDPFPKLHWDDLLVIIQIRSPCTFPLQTWNAQQIPIICLHYYSPKHQKAPNWNSSSSPQNSLVFPDVPFRH